ncbi:MULTISPECIES: hypothetical protein [unclassified Microcoleus]|uniref:hypothetical protein n=1 Tax=unclassified Microcoleus TaxID=2642155 RepID=UPI002FD77F9B
MTVIQRDRTNLFGKHDYALLGLLWGNALRRNNGGCDQQAVTEMLDGCFEYFYWLVSVIR